MQNKLPINEYFPTIQGEATYTGQPAFFIRLQQCPVGCGFCDTKYTWHLNKKDEVDDLKIIENKKNLKWETGEGNSKYIYLSNVEILAMVGISRIKHVVFTGGEPCMYDLRPITNLLHEHKYKTQIETSGTFEIKASDDTWVTVSPKIGNTIKGNKTVLGSSYRRANEIKYPVGKMQDILNLQKIIVDYDIKDKDIWLQPLSTSEKATDLCVQMAMTHNWRISIQTHKYINVR